jgi:hypothetical protein
MRAGIWKQISLVFFHWTVPMLRSWTRAQGIEARRLPKASPEVRLQLPLLHATPRLQDQFVQPRTYRRQEGNVSSLAIGVKKSEQSVRRMHICSCPKENRENASLCLYARGGIHLSVSFAVHSPQETSPSNVQFPHLNPNKVFKPNERLQLATPLSSPELSKASSSTSPLLRMYAQTSSYEALVTFSAGILGTSFVWPSINGLLSSGVSECSALLPFSRQVLTAGTSA